MDGQQESHKQQPAELAVGCVTTAAPVEGFPPRKITQMHPGVCSSIKKRSGG